MKQLCALLLSVGFVLSGCASRPESIEAAYVSPLEYSDYNCSQLAQELRRIGRKVQEVAGDQSDQATNDAVAMGVGLVIFWPALFFLIGDDRAEEFARLKGESEAVEQAAIAKECHDLLRRMDEERKAIEQRHESAS